MHIPIADQLLEFHVMRDKPVTNITYVSSNKKRKVKKEKPEYKLKKCFEKFGFQIVAIFNLIMLIRQCIEIVTNWNRRNRAHVTMTL